MIVDNNLNLGISDPFSDEHNSTSPIETLPSYGPEHHSNRTSLIFRRSQTLPNVISGTSASSSRPPMYSVPRPSQPQIYTFTTWSEDTTLLLPPFTARNRSPLYRISVALNLNPFAPLSYITTVRRGGDIDGEVAGEFELAVAHSRATVTLGNHSVRMASVLTNFDQSPPPRTIWRWKHSNVDFRWDCRTTLEDGSPMCVCLDARKLQLASFVPPPLDASPPIPDATLTVFPDGHQFLDDILLSALVIARKMTLSF